MMLIAAPIVIDRTVAVRPTNNETFDPCTTRVSTESPKSSVPSGYSRDGGSSTGPLTFEGSTPDASAKTAKIAMAAKPIRIARPAIPIVLLRYWRQNRDSERRRRVQRILRG